MRNVESLRDYSGSSFVSPNSIAVAMVLLYFCFLVAQVHGQVSVLTSRNDNARTGANNSETLLTPANVNSNNFGFLFSQTVDGYIVGQPLYLSNVFIPGAGSHNVVYVATLHDSVYAFDADGNAGTNAAPLWQANFTDPANGITTASGAFLPCPGVTGFPEAGIVSTPVIDANTGTLYVVAKTNENGTVAHHLYALDLATGQQKASILVTATYTANSGKVITFNSLHQMNRPGLLLSNGKIYVAFGSNGCNDGNYSWVLAYDATTLQQVGTFNAAPGKGLASIWQSGGPAADDLGNLYVSTSESTFNANVGGQDYGSSILKLNQSTGKLDVADYFTPYNQSSLSARDLDISSCGVLVLPDQAGAHPHLLVASGKEGTVYVLDRDNMGRFNAAGDTQIVQEFPLAVGPMFSSPVYWNNTVYFSGKYKPIKGYGLSGGLLSSVPIIQSAQNQPGGHAPSISANGNTNGILWVIGGPQLSAFDAVTLAKLYATNQLATRDALPPMAHFSTQTIANGRVYVGTQASLRVYGLLPKLLATGGNGQTATVFTELSVPLQVKAATGYSGGAISGATVAFSDGGKGGSFSPSSVITDGQGLASTTYTLPKTAKTVTITASSPGLAKVTFTETGTPGSPRWVLVQSGNQQSAPVTTMLPLPLVVKLSDSYGNGISGITVNFSAGTFGGTLSASSGVTNSLGRASVNYTTSTKAGKATILGTVAGMTSRAQFTETVTAGPAASIVAISGSGQTAAANTPLPSPFVARVNDQYGNPVPGTSVSFSDGGAGGTFAANSVTTDSTGTASAAYTTPPSPGQVTVAATVAGVATAVNFMVSVQ